MICQGPTASSGSGAPFMVRETPARFSGRGREVAKVIASLVKLVPKAETSEPATAGVNGAAPTTPFRFKERGA